MRFMKWPWKGVRGNIGTEGRDADVRNSSRENVMRSDKECCHMIAYQESDLRLVHSQARIEVLKLECLSPTVSKGGWQFTVEYVHDFDQNFL